MPGPGNPKKVKPLKKGTARAKQIAAMGGAASNKNGKLSLAQKLVWLKKKGVTEENSMELYQWMTDREYGNLDIIKSLLDLKRNAQDNKEMMAVIDRLMNAQKMQHGDIKQIDMRVASVNLNEPLSKEAMSIIFREVNNEDEDD